MNIASNNKMVLQYIWIEDHGCYHNVGINFSSKYKFTYNHKDDILFENNKDKYVDYFFGDNIDVTTIIGNNGAGKTTLLRFIFDIMHDCPAYTDYFVIFQEKINDSNEDKFFYFSNFQNNKTYGLLHINGCCCYTFEDTAVKDLVCNRDIRTIYFTELFNISQYMNSFGGDDDLSFAALLHKQFSEGYEEENEVSPILKYNHRIIDWQINYLIKEDEISVGKFFRFHYPKQLYIHFSYNSEIFNEFYTEVKVKQFVNSRNTQKKPYAIIENELRYEIEEKKKVYEIEARKYYNEFKGEKENNAIDECAQAVLFNILNSRKYYHGRDKDEDEKIFDIIDKVKNDSSIESDRLWDKLKRILWKMQKLVNTNEVFCISSRIAYYLNFMEKYSDYINKHRIDYNSTYKELTINIYDESDNNIPKMEIIRDFFESYKKCISFVEFLSFSWGLSSGEMMLLNLFSKLTHLLNFENGKTFLSNKNNTVFFDSEKPVSNAIILLDEAEVAYHPEWQRLYFQSVLNFLKKNIMPMTHVQLIIATHSPIILSDIPKQNTLVLLKNRDNVDVVENISETFAANIYTLFRNNFFLDESGMGCFALSKLESIIKEINSDTPDKEQIKKYINLVGDPFLKDKLFHAFNSRFCSSDELTQLKQRKALLEARIAELNGGNIS